MMRKIWMLPLMLLGLAVIAFGVVPEAMAAGIVGSKHDLSATGGSSSLGQAPANQEICIYCHTPHFTSTEAEPLWNRQLSTANYDLYSSSTFDATAGQQQPFGVSKACLSCHDGTVGFNALLNNRGPGTSTPSTDSTMTGAFTRIAEPTAGANLDLSNDHPISMRYTQANSPSGLSGLDDHSTGFYSEFTAGGREYVNKGATVVDVDALPLYSDGTNSDFVQCGSCHDPHREATEAGAVFFLRKSNVGSALCLTCHKKDG